MAFQDHLAVYGQITDDLADAREDLVAARFTFVGNSLLGLGPGDSAPPNDLKRALLEGLLLPSRTDRIRDALLGSAAEAADRIPEEAPEPLHELARALDSRARSLDERIHSSRVRWVFGHELETAGLSGSTQYRRGDARGPEP